jgi:NAD(P)-dependent dehydrogenase (short-subunit alcohol dehydrogenase family)
MAKTVLITGASTGIGRATALYFQQQGWNVVATMRTPAKETQLATLPNVTLLPLDVTQPESIKSALAAAFAKFGKLDAVVNNAGYALSGVFEAYTPEQIRRQFETNLFGLMEVCRQTLPYFRKQRAGTLVNVASMGGRLTVPLYSSYHSTKWAVEGFSESLHYELLPLGIRVKIIEPGAIKTDFYERSADVAKVDGLPDYQETVAVATANMNAAGDKGEKPEVVAKAIFQAASDTSNRLRYTVGGDAKMLLLLRRLLPETWFYGIVRSQVMKKKG